MTLTTEELDARIWLLAAQLELTSLATAAATPAAALTFLRTLARRQREASARGLTLLPPGGPAPLAN